MRKKIVSLILCIAISLSSVSCVSVMASNTLGQADRFSDVDTEAWYYEYVEKSYEMGLFNGTDKDKFSPESGMTRAMFVTVLSRVEQIDESIYSGTIFSDVEDGTWYAPAVKWASDIGIVEGYGDGKFGTYDDISREEMATFICRYVVYKNFQLASITVSSVFKDEAMVAIWAKEALVLMKETGIIEGDDEGNFNPQSSASRVEGAAVFVRLCSAANIELIRLPLTGVIIGVDAGHQSMANLEKEPVAPGSSTTKVKVTGGTKGTTTGIPEYELNLQVALKLEQKLIDLGATVIMVRRTNDVDISNVQRATMMNDAGADLVIRIHANGSESSSVNGAMMLVPSGSHTTAIQAESIAAGEIIFESYLTATGAKNMGVIKRDDLTGFNWSEVPVCLIELGYMTNPREDRLMATDDYRALCAQGLAEGILKWYESN